MKQAFAFTGTLAVGAGLFLAVGSLVGWGDILGTLRTFSGWKGLAILLLTFPLIFVSAVRWRVILKRKREQIPLRSAVELYTAGFAISFLVPFMILGAETLRAYATRRFFGIPFSKGFATTLIERILDVTAYLVFVAVGLVIFFIQAGEQVPQQVLWAAFGFPLLLAAAVGFFYFKSFRRESMLKLFIPRRRFQNAWEIEQEVLQFFHVKNPAFWEASALSLMKTGFALVRAWVLIVFLAPATALLVAFPVLAFQYISLLIPIPASLGTHELLQAVAFQHLGLGSSTGAAFVIVMRAAELLIALVGVLLLVRVGIRILGGFVEDFFNKVE